MNKNQNAKSGWSKLFSTRRFKYGAVATLFTVLFIAAVILVNVIVSAVHSVYSLYIDLTPEQLFTISDESAEYVQHQFDNFKEEYGIEPEIEITFLQARDRILDDKSNHKPEVLNLVESYAEKFSQIKVNFDEDVLSHPEQYEEYKRLGHQINSNAVLVENKATQTKSFRYLSFDQFLVFDTEEANTAAWAFRGEIKLNSALYYVTAHDRPVVSFTEGHGEIIPDKLYETLEDCGFEIKKVNLSEEELDPATKILFMCSPQKDILYDSSDAKESEYTRIVKYLNDFGSMVVIGSPSTPELPVLDEILDSKGLKLVRNQMVKDDTFSHPQSNQMIFANYAPSASVAATLTESLTKLDSPPRTVIPDSAHIELTKEGDGELTSIESVLTSSDNSYVEVIGEDGKETVKGPFNLMAISTRWDYVDNVRNYGHVILIASDAFFDDSPFTAQFANSNITYNMIRLLSNEFLPEGDDIKPFQSTALDIDSGEAITYGIVSAVVIPLAIFTVGIVVFVKRKHK